MKILLHGISRLPDPCRQAVLFHRAVRLALGRTAAARGELNVIFLSNRQIRTINKRYLSHDCATDVIAFPYHKGGAPKVADTPFGDVYVSYDRAKRQARELGHSHLKELLTLAIHGTLHLMGYDDHKPADRRRMFARQDIVLSMLKINRTWAHPVAHGSRSLRTRQTRR